MKLLELHYKPVAIVSRKRFLFYVCSSRGPVILARSQELGGGFTQGQINQ